MGIIFYASSMEAYQIPSIDIPNIDKLFHFIEYFILGFLMVRAFFHSSSVPNHRRIFIFALSICLIYGISDEVHQLFVVGRSYEIIDIISDIFGSAAGAWIFLYKERIKSAFDKTI